MTSPFERPASVGDAIVVDEIGLESGSYGPYRLRSSYQPIFARRGRSLEPVAVEGLIAPFLAGEPLTPHLLFGAVPEKDRLFVESMCRALHLRNHHNIGVPTLQLHFNYDPRANSDLKKSLNEIRLMARQLIEIDLDPRLLVCEITQAVALDPAVLAALVAEMRGQGIRIAIDDFGTGDSTLERFELVTADIVKIDGAWFRALGQEPAAIKFLGAVISGFRHRGAKVLIQGIEDPVQLRQALTAGADLFQGYLLGRPALVGTVFEEDSLDIATLIGGDRKVLPLLG